ncbi:preprotein translocase subunit SecY [Clostridium sp.]|uniref:preprotein translocase subunit SecY n=1 Tax=Clostridium sp. TaxID=1506 RepID=UPI0026332959|nr:preprotein translocase subunit SecY [Clostridium sp.]
MLQTLRNAFKVPEIRKRILWTILLVAVFRMGSHVPLPGINSDYLSKLSQSGGLLGFYDMLSGGAFSRSSILALGVMPYINASIIIQLLTVAIPQLEQLSKEGDTGRKKIQNATRYVSLGIAFILAYGIYATISSSGATVGLNSIQKVIVVFALVVGTTFCMWLGDQLTVKGIGNGTSVLIFVNIISRVPTTMASMMTLQQAGSASIIEIVLFGVFIVLLLATILYFSLSERRIPVQYAGKFASGNSNMVKAQSATHIPLSIIGSAVLAIIFSMSVMEFPKTIATLFGGIGESQKEWAKWILSNPTSVFNQKSWMYVVLYAILTIFFNWFYMQITFKPDEMSENLHKSAGFVPGVRPGEETTVYFERVLSRLAFIGGILAAILAVTPVLIQNYTQFQNIAFSGTGLLIVINVALDFTRKVESQMVVRHYKGFLK